MNQPRGLLKILKLDSLIHNLIEYIETRIALVKAEAKDDVMKAMRAAIIYGTIAVLGLFFVLFLSLTIALALNAALDSRFWGFAIVTGLYLIMLLTLYALRDSEKVKNMFGDGSLAFLSKDAAKEEQEKEKKEQEEEKEKEEELKIVEYQRTTFEQAPRPPIPSSPARKKAEINIEKKENP